MKAKTFLITAFIFLQVHFLFSQCISIELSVTWEKGYDITKEDSVVNAPKLNIIYRNNCNANYYLLKMSHSLNGLPYVPCHILYNNRVSQEPLTLNIEYLNGKNANMNFIVKFEDTPFLFKDWWVSIDPEDNDDKDAPINCLFNSIYAYIFSDRNSTKYELTRKYFEFFDETHKDILNSFRDQFIFVKSNETFIDIYDLVGFQILGGCYTFNINQNSLNNYIKVYQPDFVTHIYNELKIELPAVVGEYQRYSGAFNTNKVTVCFGDR
jgi:hypothetical protein